MNILGEQIYAISEKSIKEKRELQAVFDSRKSFYGKAYIICLKNGDILLQSYNTIVAILYSNGTFVSEKFSQTTNRHIAEFKKQLNISEKGGGKK